MANIDAPDWLNVAPTGNGAILDNGSVSVPSGGGGYTGVIFPTYGFEALAINTKLGVGNWSGRWTVTFYTDPLGASPVWTTPRSLFDTVGINAYQTIPVMGPYANIQVFQTTGSSQNFQYNILGLVNATGLAPIVPPQLVVNQQNTALAGSGQPSFSPSMLAPGHYKAWAQCGQLVVVSIQRWNGAGLDDIIQVPGGSTTAWAGYFNFDFEAPIDEWSANVFNTTAIATSFYLAITGPY